jgi:DNA-binding response OmpR family regulator
MHGRQILVVDDEIEINQLISLYLTKEGFEVAILEHGNDVIPFVRTHKPELIILDILLPGINGIDLCRELRKFTQIPIIFVSCKTDDLDVILGLEVGGDDYITKPFSPSQLVARVKANLRRNLLSSPLSTNKEDKLTFTGLEINIGSHFVLLNGNEISLSTKEFDLLVIMAQHPHRVFKIDELYQRIWGSDSFGDTRTLIVHISNLRKKIESDITNPKYILTVRGIGYKFNHTLQQFS